jgi:hypothetical protein
VGSDGDRRRSSRPRARSTVGRVPGVVGFVDRGDEFPYKERSIVDSLALAGLTNSNALMILTVA